MRIHTVSAIALLAPFFMAHANATDFCDDPPDIDVSGQAYVTIDAVLSHGYLWSIWVYCEGNGIPGLQRGGVTLLGDADICQNSAVPDMCFWM